MVAPGRLCWFQFRLREWFLLVMVVALCIAWWRAHREAVKLEVECRELEQELLASELQNVDGYRLQIQPLPTRDAQTLLIGP